MERESGGLVGRGGRYGTGRRPLGSGLGIVLDIDVKPIKPKDSKATQTKEGLSHTNYAIGAINYPDGTAGTFIYL